MAQINTQKVSLSGLSLQYTAASAGGDTIANNGHLVIHVKNAAAASITVTAKAQTPCNQGVLHDDAVTVAAGAELVIGPFSPGRFNDQSGNLTLNYSDVTSVTVAPVYLA